VFAVIFNPVVVVAALIAQQVPSSSELAGSFLWQTGGLESPVACAISSSGTIAVADASGEIVGLAATDGSVLWRTRTAGDEKLSSPSGIAALADGSFLVSDSRRRRIEHFSAAGAWIGPFATAVALRSPAHIAVSAGAEKARIAIVDEGTNEIVLCSHAGEEIRRITSAQLVLPDGSLAAPSGIAFVGADRLAVSASEQNRIFLLDISSDTAAPTVLHSWGARGPFPGLFNHPRGMASDGHWIFVADQFNHRVTRQDKTGKGQLAYGQHAVRPRDGAGAVHYPVAIAIGAAIKRGDVTGPLAIVCEPFERRVQAFVPGLDAEPADIRLVLPKLESVQSHFGSSVARDGMRLFLHDPESCTVVVFDLSKGQPLHVSNLGSTGSKPHEIGRVDALLAINDGTRLLIADGINRRLALWELTAPPKEIIFEPFMAKLVKTRSYDRLDLPAGAIITGLTRAIDGKILALSSSGPCIVTLDVSLRSAQTLPIAAPDTTALATAIASAVDGTVGVTFDRPAMLCQYRFEGNAWRTAGCRGLKDVIFASALIAAKDEWMILDTWSDSLVRYGTDGSVRRIGGRGVADGQMWLPGAATVGADGEIYLVDSGNHRAQRFSAAGEWQMTFSLGRAYTRARTADEVLRIRKKPDAPSATKP